MKESEIKRFISDKVAIISNVMLPSQANAYGNVHGGEIMKMMDSAAGCASSKYAHGMAVTARVEELLFLHPVTVGQLLTCFAEVVYAGTTSMIVYVRVVVEDTAVKESNITALTGLFTMVSLDKNGRPAKVERLEQPEDEEELQLYLMGKERYMLNKTKKN
ncbi:MAG: acyl-CoA thioesterase [Cellulosilyticaceae bacterium]